MITQKELAEFLGVSPQHLAGVKKHLRLLGRRAAVRGAARTGIPAKELLFLEGPALIERLKIAYQEQKNG